MGEETTDGLIEVAKDGRLERSKGRLDGSSDGFNVESLIGTSVVDDGSSVDTAGSSSTDGCIEWFTEGESDISNDALVGLVEVDAGDKDTTVGCLLLNCGAEGTWIGTEETGETSFSIVGFEDGLNEVS